MRGEFKEGDDLWTVCEERVPGRLLSPREHTIPTWTNPPGSNKGFGFLGGMNALKHRCMADEVMRKSARANRDDGNVVSTTRREVKALKGETHERWELK